MSGESWAAQIFGATNIHALLFFHNNKDPREAELWLREILTESSQLGVAVFFFPPLQWKQLICWINGRNTARTAAYNSFRANNSSQHWSLPVPAAGEPLPGFSFLLRECERASIWAPRVSRWIGARRSFPPRHAEQRARLGCCVCARGPARVRAVAGVK